MYDLIFRMNNTRKIAIMYGLKEFPKDKIEEYEIGTFKGLSDIHKFLFDDIYFFAGKIRKENIEKLFEL